MDQRDVLEHEVRAAAFRWLNDQVERQGDSVLPRNLLEIGFSFRGEEIHLVGPQGIFKPRILNLPLSITTKPIVEGVERPYEDAVLDGQRILYKYRGTDPFHRENLGLRVCMQRRVPLIYFFGVTPGLYRPVWPVFIEEDDPASLSFTVDVSACTIAGSVFLGQTGVAAEPSIAERRYATRAVQQRLHQDSFRARVLQAYETRCAICNLRHAPLLQAAHIVPDREPKGDPVVPNGLSLCAIHHSAFDANILGIRPDYKLEIRGDILEETDGPMLRHGLQEMHGRSLVLPTRRMLRPDPDRLEWRFERFRKAG